MGVSQANHVFPKWTALACLTGAAVLAGPLAWAMVPLLVAGVEDQLAAVVITMGLLAWATSLISLMPVILVGPLGVMATVYGYFIGAGLRVLLCLGGWFVLSRLLGLPADATGLALVTMYVPLLMVEAGIVGRYLWMKDALAAEQRSEGPQQGKTPGEVLA